MGRHLFLTIPSSGSVRKIHYMEWGDATNPRVLVCAHGLTRCARDFDTLAQALSDHYRVVCPDAAGRGESDWLDNAADYGYTQYVADSLALLAHIGATQVDWVGTSMGGMLGMMLAAMPSSPITRMVVNDVGAVIPREALERIGRYVGAEPKFASLEQAVNMVRAVSPFGLEDSQWEQTTRPLLKQTADGQWVFRYDPAIGDVFKQGPIQDVNLTLVWNAIRCPVLVTRGALSDLLQKPVYDSMCAKPGVRGVEFAGIGHAPMFMNAEQISVVRDFLLA